LLRLADLRRFAVARSLGQPMALKPALERLGFVQADPIRAPARAQDLTLRHRVSGYHAGDLERRYTSLSIEEDVFINYGFVTEAVWALMHPRSRIAWSPTQRRRAGDVLAFVRERGVVHPREVDAHFAHGTVTNYWGGSSSATTHLLDLMHYRGLLRVAGRRDGIRLYAVREPASPVADAGERDRRLDGLVDVLVRKYAPLPARSLSMVVGRLRYAAPQWRGQLRATLTRAQARLAHVHVDGTDWYWPAGEDPISAQVPDAVRLLAPFDPVVWDRRRFERLWGWAYRFEAYTPVAKRVRGYYALPLLWRDTIVGWANVSIRSTQLEAELGYVNGVPRERGFRRALDLELDRLRAFLKL
jgi:uncharacterized protein YcaQ